MSVDRRSFVQKIFATSLLSGIGFPSLSANHQDFNKNGQPAIIHPNHLSKGDKIKVLAPAGAIYEDIKITEFVEVLEGMGFIADVGDTVFQKRGNLAGYDLARAKELNESFADEEIKGIVAIRGGWGSARILPYVDFDLIRKNPKVFLGYSDISALLNAIYVKSGLITFHGPVGVSNWNRFTKKHFKKVLLENETDKIKSSFFFGNKAVTIVPGEVTGALVGGNLSVISALVGTEYLPSYWSDKVLFLEEIGEEPYRIDRMLTQLKLSGILKEVRGVVFGKCKNCEAEFPEHSLTIEEILNDHLAPLKVPSFFNANIGHIDHMYTLPIGGQVVMDASKRLLSLDRKYLD